MKEVHYCRWVLRVYKLTPLFVPSLCFLCMDENVTSQLPVPTTMLSLPVSRPPSHECFYPSGAMIQNKPSSLLN